MAIEYWLLAVFLLGGSWLADFVNQLSGERSALSSALFWFGLMLFPYSILYAISENLVGYLDRACDGRGAGG